MAHGIKQVISFFPPNMKGKDDENDGAAVIKEENTWNIYFHNLNRIGYHVKANIEISRKNSAKSCR